MSQARWSFAATAFQAVSRYSLVALLVLSGSLNIVLAHKISNPRVRSEALVSTGTQVPPLRGFASTGAVSIDFPSQLPVLLYYFSPSCGWCKRNWDNIKALHSAANGRYRLIALSTVASVDGNLEALLPGLEVIWGMNAEFLAAYRLGATPTTVFVSSAGRVQRAWAGAFQGRVQAEIESLLGIKLPGLTR